MLKKLKFFQFFSSIMFVILVDFTQNFYVLLQNCTSFYHYNQSATIKIFLKSPRKISLKNSEKILRKIWEKLTKFSEEVLWTFDVWRGVWRCTHAKLPPLTPHPLARDRHYGPASVRTKGGTLWGRQPFFPHFSSAT